MVVALSLVLLKSKFYKQQYLSLVLIALSFVPIALASGVSNTFRPIMILGWILLIFSETMHALAFVIEERFLKMQPNLDPTLVAGIEGVFGLVFWIIAIPIMT